MGPWFVTYTREAPVEISLLVVRDEGCLLTVETPTPPLLPERPEIGTYFWKCSPPEAENFRAVVKAAIDALAGQSTRPVQPGTRFLSFGIGKKGDETVDPNVFLSLASELPVTAIAVDKAALDLAKQGLAHPHLTLKAAAALGKPGATWQPGDELGLQVTLSNTGAVPLTIHNPAAAARPGIAVLLRDVEDELAFIDVKKGEVTAASAEPQVTLAPGASLGVTVKLRRHIYVRRGPHRVTVRFTSDTTDIPETQAIGGFVHADAGRLTVGKQAKGSPPAAARRAP